MEQLKFDKQLFGINNTTWIQILHRLFNKAQLDLIYEALLKYIPHISALQRKDLNVFSFFFKNLKIEKRKQLAKSSKI